MADNRGGVKKMADERNSSLCRLELRDSSASSTVSSPMTDLAANLDELARFDGTPRRRISWSSNESSSPCLPQILLLKDDGFYDSPNTSTTTDSTDSPVFQERALKDIISKHNAGTLCKSNRMRRFYSMPAPNADKFCGKENVPKRNGSLASPTKATIKNVKIEDSSSSDSGFNEMDEINTAKSFKFPEPIGVMAARRTQSETSKSEVGSRVPLSSVSVITIQNAENCEPTPEINVDHLPTSDVLAKDVEADTEDDGFLDELDSRAIAQNSVPFGIERLINGRLRSLSTDNSTKTLDHVAQPQLSNVGVVDVDTPKGRNCIRGLFGAQRVGGDKRVPFKRPDVPKERQSPVQSKRRKSMSFCQARHDSIKESDEIKITPKRVGIQRCFSETEATIMNAVQRSVDDPFLIGDLSNPYLLPLINGKHQDLKSISHHTIVQLLRGMFEDAVEKFMIVDCRYPYEYEGGHIKGALNIYTKEGILQEFFRVPYKLTNSCKRVIVIFHCEFSSERGPNLSRFLRNKDREANEACYPHLHYPEIYILEGGYKSFFENHRHLCEPPEYKPMLHKDHENDLRHFRAKSKSWNGDKGGRHGSQSGLKL